MKTQAREASRPHGNGYALASVGIIGVALAYAVTVNFLSIIPETMCLEIAGGPGCDR